MDDRPLRQQHPAGVPAVHAGRDAQSASEDTRKVVSPRRDGGLRPSREQSDRARVFPLGKRTSPLEAYSPHSTVSVCQAVLVHETITNCCGDGGSGKPPPPERNSCTRRKREYSWPTGGMPTAAVIVNSSLIRQQHASTSTARPRWRTPNGPAAR